MKYQKSSSDHNQYVILQIHINFFEIFSETNSTKVIRVEHQSIPWLSSLFLVLTVSRTSLPIFTCVTYSLSNLATMTFLGSERVQYGNYLLWQHLGTGILTFISASVACAIRIDICGNRRYGYFASFLIAAFLLLMSLMSLSMFEFEYETDRVITWDEVKSIVLRGHYILMFTMTFCIGVFVSFQVHWEFWYLDGLQAGPFVMGTASVIRRTFLAVCFFVSSNVMKKIGDLNTLCIALLLFTVGFLLLSLTRVYWFVLAVDFLHSAGYGLSTSALTVHFSKAGTKADLGIILGRFCTYKTSHSNFYHILFSWSLSCENYYSIPSYSAYQALWGRTGDWGRGTNAGQN